MALRRNIRKEVPQSSPRDHGHGVKLLADLLPLTVMRFLSIHPQLIATRSRLTYMLSMKNPVVILFVLLLSLQTGCSLGQRAADVPCHNDMIETSPGVILPLSSGQTYQVFPTDNPVSVMWQPLDKLSVCPTGGGGVTITNLSDKKERVRALFMPDSSWFLLQGQAN